MMHAATAVQTRCADMIYSQATVRHKQESTGKGRESKEIAMVHTHHTAAPRLFSPKLSTWLLI